MVFFEHSNSLEGPGPSLGLDWAWAGPGQASTRAKTMKKYDFPVVLTKNAGKPVTFLEFPRTSNFYDVLPTFQLFGGSWPRLGSRPGLGLAQDPPEIGKLEKHHKSWRSSATLGNSWIIAGFSNVFRQKRKRHLMFLIVFALGRSWPCPAQAQSGPRPVPGPSRKLECWKNSINVWNAGKVLGNSRFPIERFPSKTL